MKFFHAFSVAALFGSLNLIVGLGLSYRNDELYLDVIFATAMLAFYISQHRKNVSFALQSYFNHKEILDRHFEKEYLTKNLLPAHVSLLTIISVEQ